MRLPIPPSLKRMVVFWPYAALAVSMLFFASNHVLGRLIPGEVPPVGLSFWRWVLASLIILPFTWKGLIHNAPLITAHWKLFLQLTISLVVLGNQWARTSYWNDGKLWCRNAPIFPKAHQFLRIKRKKSNFWAKYVLKRKIRIFSRIMCVEIWLQLELAKKY